MTRYSTILGNWQGLAIGVAACMAGGLAAPAALAQTSYDQGYYATATRDDPDVGRVSDTSQYRYTSAIPLSGFVNGSASVTRTDIDPVTGLGLYYGSANSQGQAVTGDRFVKASTLSSLDFTTGSTNAFAVSIWSSQATPSTDTLADIRVLLDRSLYFGDFLGNTDRGNQILDFATANIPSFQQAAALTLQASVYLNVLIRELKSGNTWNATLQEEVNRKFVFFKDSDGNPFVTGGIGDRAFSIFRTGSTISGVPSEIQSFEEHVLNFDADGYPPRYATSFSSIFGIDTVMLRGGQQYDVSLTLTCSSNVSALSGLAESSAYSAGCNAGNSGYWLGLDNFRDFNGDAIAPVSFASTDSGFDLALRSPSAPGGGIAPVPEPATWALVIGGFGLAGAALRRRRVTVAA